jgi:hypothetical protein
MPKLMPKLMLKNIARIVVTGLLLMSAGIHAEPTGFRAYQLAKHGSLQLAVPRSWSDQMRQRPNDAPPTILFTPEQGSSFNVQVTPIWPAKHGVAIPGAEDIKLTVSKAADEEKSQAIETTIPVQEIQGASGNGYYFTITDRAPKTNAPDEFKYMTKGMLSVGKLILAFTIFSNDGAESAVTDTMTMLKSARQVETAKR